MAMQAAKASASKNSFLLMLVSLLRWVYYSTQSMPCNKTHKQNKDNCRDDKPRRAVADVSDNSNNYKHPDDRHVSPLY